MRILFLTDNFPPEVNAPATRTIEHCKEWVKAGHQVTVVTCYPNFPKGVVYPGYKNSFFSKTEIIEGIKVIRVWTYIAANEGFVRRVIDYLTFAFMAFWKGLFIKTDVIVATSPQFFTAVAGYALSVAKRKKWIFELRDLWPDTIKSVSAMNNEAILRWLEKLELFLYRKADKVIALTNAFKTNLVARGIDPSKIHVVTNGANLSLFKPVEKDQQLVQQLRLHNKFVIGYIGTHGMTHNLEGIVSQIPMHQHVHFVFIGDGATKNRMKEIIAQRQLPNVSMLDSVTKNEMPRYWSIVDLALVPLRKDPTFLTVIPSKIFEACAMKKPVLLGVDGQAREIIDEYNCGIVFEPENVNEMMTKIERVRSDQAFFAELQKNTLRLAHDYDRQILAAKMLGHIEELAV